MLAKRSALILILALVGACKSRVPDSELAAKVNGEGITKKDFEAEVERNLARYRGQAHELPPGIEDRIKESVLRRMIDDKVIEQKAKSLNIQVAPDELNAKMDEHKKRFRTDEAFKAYLERSNNTEASIKAELERNLLRDRVVDKLSGPTEVTPDEVKQYYNENLDRFKENEQLLANRILIRVASDAKDSDKKAAKKEAQALKAKLVKGADFADLAQKNSKGPEAARGGDLGWFSRGRFTPEFDAAVFKMNPKATSDVIETKLGYEIVRVLDKKPERQKPLEEVQASIQQSLDARKKNQKRRDVLRQLKTETKVEQLIQFNTEKPPVPAETAPADQAAPAPAPAPAGGPTGQMQPAPSPAPVTKN
jgi:peptidyl-prolyl cis-trans isomerase C